MGRGLGKVLGQRCEEAVYRRGDRKGQEARDKMGTLLSTQRSTRCPFPSIRLARLESWVVPSAVARPWAYRTPGALVGMATSGASHESHPQGSGR